MIYDFIKNNFENILKKTYEEHADSLFYTVDKMNKSKNIEYSGFKVTLREPELPDIQKFDERSVTWFKDANH